MAARMRSPVVILGSPSRSARILPCVPLPEPGAPRMRMNTGKGKREGWRRGLLLLPTAELDAAFLHEAVIVPEQQVLLDLLDGVEGHADDDEEGCPTAAGGHVEHAAHDDRQNGDDREADRLRQGYA